MTTDAPPASRNAPCPCGSGRRYKDCHGSVAAAAPAPAADDVGARMRAALEAQQAGRIAEAIAVYDRVLADRPDLFDAWHMRGVAKFQLLAFDGAERDIKRALALEPRLDAARGNLALVLQGRRIAEDEVALCRELLPRFAALAATPARAPLDGVSPGTHVHVVDAASTRDIADAIARDAASAGAAVTHVAIERGRTIDGEAARVLAAAGDDDVIVAIGCERPLGDWTLEAGPRALALVASTEPLTAFVDRLREASGQGRRKVSVALAANATLDVGPVPHVRSATW